MSARASRAPNSCPVCNTDLGDEEKLGHAERNLQKEVAARIQATVRAQADEHKQILRQVRDKHKEELKGLRKAYAGQQKELRDAHAAGARKQKMEFAGAIARLRKEHQEELGRLREQYDREYLRLQKEQEAALNLQLKEILQNYGSLAAGQQKEQERFKKMHDENEAQLRRKDAELTRLKIELARSSSKLELKDLMIKLQERDSTIGRLNSRIEELEGRAAAPPPNAPPSKPAKPLTEEEQKQKLKEYMRAIIEIARAQQAEKKKEPPNQEKPGLDLPESKVDKKLGWFF